MQPRPIRPYHQYGQKPEPMRDFEGLNSMCLNALGCFIWCSNNWSFIFITLQAVTMCFHGFNALFNYDLMNTFCRLSFCISEFLSMRTSFRVWSWWFKQTYIVISVYYWRVVNTLKKSILLRWGKINFMNLLL